MKFRTRTADGGKHARFTIIHEAVKDGKVVAKDYTKDGLKQKLKALGYEVADGRA